MFNTSQTSWLQVSALALFGGAVVHTFLVGSIRKFSRNFKKGSVRETTLHWLGEVEVVFGLWAALLLALMGLALGPGEASHFAESLSFREPLFVFVIMVISASGPLLELVGRLLKQMAKALPMPPQFSVFMILLFVGPLLGSVVTEPAAMTLVALMLRDTYFGPHFSTRFKYACLALLFVNVSVGGAFTPFAAPAILMVATVWGWDSHFLWAHFGWKCLVAMTLNVGLFVALFFGEFKSFRIDTHDPSVKGGAPGWIQGVHLLFLIAVVMTHKTPVLFVGLFLFFIGFTTISEKFQSVLKLKESLLVGFFLAGLVVIGAAQDWWLKDFIEPLKELQLFTGATALTSVMDNAALTYLGSLVPGVSPGFQYALVAGALAGGGLTVIANAPNPAGYTILNDRFGKTGIHPLGLLAAALVPTLIVMICLWYLPHLA